MNTYTVCIGNSDDKLTQVAWSDFINKLIAMVDVNAQEIHFSGHSLPNSPYQMYCIVFVMDGIYLDRLKETLSSLCSRFGQDSIALTAGKTEFVRW